MPAPLMAATEPAVPLPDANPSVVEFLEPLLADVRLPYAETAAAQLRLTLGPPDLFRISYEASGDEADALPDRFETWVYYDILTAFEFRNGELIADGPVEELAGTAIFPFGFDPTAFVLDTSWAEIETLLPEGAEVTTTDIPAEAGTEGRIYATEHLLVIITEVGLIYAESLPLVPPDAG